ncbi:MAG: terminase TerL endonuclease subunit [Candidatus Rokuibacteriota bacterium]
MIRRRAIAPRAPEDPAVAAYLRTGKYPIRGESKHFSWDCWTTPKRRRTPKADAERAAAFISSLTHSKGPAAGQAFRLRDWQHSIVAQIFGTLDADGYRVIRTALIELPTRNGKSELAAALALYMLCGDQEQGAEVYSVAIDTDQASLVFNVASTMVRRDPELAARLEVVPSRRRIIHHASESVYRVLAADAPSALGVNASAVVMDELAAWPGREMFDVMQSRTGSRRAPVTIAITTAGDDEHSVGAEVHRYAERVRDGIIPDPSFLPVIYAAPADADPWAEATWYAANPALQDFRSLEEFRVAARQAREVPGREASFKKLYLNMWGTHAETRWLDLARWDACAEPVDPAALRGQPCIVGLDLSTTTDLTAMVVIFPPDADGIWDVRAEFWVPADYLELRSRRDRVPYTIWAQEGHLHVTDGNTVDYGAIERRLHELVEADGFDVVAIGIDPWNARSLTTKLQGDGLPAVEVAQTMANLSGAAKELERLVLAGRLRHGGHPVLRWCISNTAVDTDSNGNLKPSKKRSRERIDGTSGLVTALALAHVAHEEAPAPRITVLG